MALLQAPPAVDRATSLALFQAFGSCQGHSAGATDRSRDALDAVAAAPGSWLLLRSCDCCDPATAAIMPLRPLLRSCHCCARIQASAAIMPLLDPATAAFPTLMLLLRSYCCARIQAAAAAVSVGRNGKDEEW